MVVRNLQGDRQESSDDRCDVPGMRDEDGEEPDQEAAWLVREGRSDCHGNEVREMQP